MMNWGRFTVKGTEKVETKINEMLQQIAAEFSRHLAAEEYKAVILLGGYGRGEGGVLTEDGVEKPHNNFDLLLIHTQDVSEKIITLRKQLEVLSGKLEIGIDLGTIAASKLKRAQCRVMWYDMRFGHKVILGDKNFVRSLRQFQLKNIPAWDVRNLMVNRGTLMIINDLLLDENKLDRAQKKLIIKHIVKAVIGYGDALLYFLGDYSWSYVEKQQRMRKQNQVDQDVKQLYEEAMEFRFQPDYAEFLQKNLLSYTEILREKFAQIFLNCESMRLGKEIKSWREYPDIAFRKTVCQDLFSPKSWAKKALNFIKSSKYAGKADWLAALGYRFLGEKGLLPVFFPYIAYKLENEYFKSLLQNFLTSDHEDFRELRRSYLQHWGRLGDVNFVNVLRKYHIQV